ncbi:unnamed protein product [Amoebophrya sp. A25]|nr:unnamed protein product [Amoebophrya sp. A25]|eukprot:GSA25T00017584001.1
MPAMSSRLLVASAVLLLGQDVGAKEGTKMNLKKASKVRVLNDPSEKVGARINMLKQLRQKLSAMAEQKLLKDQKPKLDEVTKKIDVVLDIDSPSEETVEHAVKDVESDVEVLKSALMRRAMELADEQHKRMQEQFKATGATASSPAFMRKKTAEDAFDKLMEIQDSPLKEQLAVLKEFESDSFVKEFLNSKFNEGDNLAMRLGQALDNRKEIEAQAKEKKELKNLATGAHLNEDQAKTLLPILAKVRDQQMQKKSKLAEVNRQLATLEEQERVFKKRKALLSKETSVLGDAVHAIEGGEIDNLSQAMNKLKELSV